MLAAEGKGGAPHAGLSAAGFNMRWLQGCAADLLLKRCNTYTPCLAGLQPDQTPIGLLRIRKTSQVLCTASPSTTTG